MGTWRDNESYPAAIVHDRFCVSRSTLHSRLLGLKGVSFACLVAPKGLKGFPSR